MKLYTLALLVATTVSFTFLSGKFFGVKNPSEQKIEVVAAKESEFNEVEQVRAVAVPPTPEPETALIAIQYPKEGVVVKGNPVWMQIRVNGYSLGSDSDFDRADELETVA